VVRKLGAIVGVACLLLLQGCYKTDLSTIGYHYGLPTPELHIVHRGDTLFAIGRRYDIGYQKLIRLNHITPPYTIYVGQRIYLTHAAPHSTTDFIPRQHRKSHPRALPHLPQKMHTTKKRATRRHVVHKHKTRTVHVRHASAHHKAIATIILRWPASGPVTSGFGTRGSRMHDGIDIGAKLGSPVVAAADGTVVYSDHRLSGYGNLIIIRHRKNLFTAYAHNQRNLVQRGDKVLAGQQVARIGKTGRSTGPHLHFEVRRGTTPVDPLLYLPKR